VDTKERKTEKVTLEDGRLAERRTFYDDEGSEVVEVYVEPKRNLTLDKRVINKTKTVLAEQRIQTIKDGEVVDEEVHSIEPNIRLEKRQHIQKEDYAEQGEYVTQNQLNRAVVEGVVEAMKVAFPTVQEQFIKSQDVLLEPVKDEPKRPLFSNPQPTLSAQSIVEQNIEDKKQHNMNSFILFGVIALVQIGLLGWIVMW
jgi:hypothetical protein